MNLCGTAHNNYNYIKHYCLVLQLKNSWPHTGDHSHGYLCDWITDVPKNDEMKAKLKKRFPFPISPPKVTFDSDTDNDMVHLLQLHLIKLLLTITVMHLKLWVLHEWQKLVYIKESYSPFNCMHLAICNATCEYSISLKFGLLMLLK